MEVGTVRWPGSNLIGDKRHRVLLGRWRLPPQIYADPLFLPYKSCPINVGAFLINAKLACRINDTSISFVAIHVMFSGSAYHERGLVGGT